jgi:hypothetical protein
MKGKPPSFRSGPHRCRAPRTTANTLCLAVVRTSEEEDPHHACHSPQSPLRHTARGHCLSSGAPTGGAIGQDHLRRGSSSRRRLGLGNLRRDPPPSNRGRSREVKSPPPLHWEGGGGGGGRWWRGLGFCLPVRLEKATRNGSLPGHLKFISPPDIKILLGQVQNWRVVAVQRESYRHMVHAREIPFRASTYPSTPYVHLYKMF